jgi:hypothetical protein
MKARAARVAVGLVFVAVTLWIVLPVVASERPPPKATLLFVGLNNRESTTPGEVLEVHIQTHGCTNPAIIEGILARPQSTWNAEIREARRGNVGAVPTQAAVVLRGRLDSAKIELSASESSSGERVLHNQRLSSLVIGHGAYAAYAGAVLTAPQWSLVEGGLRFVLSANLVFPLSFHRCYVDVPALIEPGGINIESTGAFAQAQEFLQKRDVYSDAYPPGSEVTAAELTVSVAGEVVTSGSVGTGGSTTTEGIRYACKPFPTKKLPSRDAFSGDIPQTIEFDGDANATCGGVPIFETPGVAADVTRRLFAAGILGALAATLIVEALFLGETEPKQQRRPS